jgi:hypothetical protein
MHRSNSPSGEGTTDPEVVKYTRYYGDETYRVIHWDGNEHDKNTTWLSAANEDVVDLSEHR